ncbi:MAG: PLP-dependent transferase [Deltaproteobacteria bacterium]|nr:MAG: PLP-dependent transferase [Deltaproteobacteria bacterium]
MSFPLPAGVASAPRAVPGTYTRILHGGLGPDPVTGAIVEPIVQSTTFVQPEVGVDTGFTYSRAANPTVSALERNLAALEGCEPDAVAFATGMAATTALCLATLKAGDHVICGDVVYGGTVRLLREILAGFDVRTTFVDPTDLDAVREALCDDTRLVFVETPANPTLKLCDLAALGRLLADHPARFVVDNTFLTAAGQPCLEHGVDVVLYSTTKYIEGHNSTVGGAILTPDAALRERIAWCRKATGSIQSPFEAWLTLRGLKTLPLRLQRHSDNALAVARFLEAHPRVSRVIYPGLPSHPQHALAAQQQLVFGGMLAFEVESTEASLEVLRRVKLCSLAENLGAVETLITHPASMTHADVPVEQRLAIGLTEGLMRLSVGLEDPEDLIADLAQALG